MMACRPKRCEEKRGPQPNFGSFYMLFLLPLDLPYVNWARQECCLFHLRSSLWSLYLPLFYFFHLGLAWSFSQTTLFKANLLTYYIHTKKCKRAQWIFTEWTHLQTQFLDQQKECYQNPRSHTPSFSQRSRLFSWLQRPLIIFKIELSTIYSFVSGFLCSVFSGWNSSMLCELIVWSLFLL